MEPEKKSTGKLDKILESYLSKEEMDIIKDFRRGKLLPKTEQKKEMPDNQNATGKEE